MTGPGNRYRRHCGGSTGIREAFEEAIRNLGTKVSILNWGYADEILKQSLQNQNFFFIKYRGILLSYHHGHKVVSKINMAASQGQPKSNNSGRRKNGRKSRISVPPGLGATSVRDFRQKRQLWTITHDEIDAGSCHPSRCIQNCLAEKAA